MKYQKIRFPKDSFPHDNVIEWWYYNGHLKDSRGRQYSFMQCLFRAEAKKVNIPFIEKIPFKFVYFYHCILCDLKNRKSYSDIRPLVLISEDSYSKKLFYVDFTSPSLKGYFNYEIKALNMSKYSIKSRFFDLVLDSGKKPLLEGGKGFLDLNNKQTYYYSLTNMKTEGYITLHDKRIKVKGKSWMDHQWADESYTRDKWSWFSLQLDNNIEIMCVEFDDGKAKTLLADFVGKDGRTKHTRNVMMVPLAKKWRSSDTGAVYPVSWKISIPEFEAELTTSAVMKTQEVLFSTINYWEGPIVVKGRINGKPVKGKGFMELASYPMKKSRSSIFRKQIIRSLRKEISQTKQRVIDIERSTIKNRRKRRMKKIRNR